MPCPVVISHAVIWLGLILHLEGGKLYARPETAS